MLRHLKQLETSLEKRIRTKPTSTNAGFLDDNQGGIRQIRYRKHFLNLTFLLVSEKADVKETSRKAIFGRVQMDWSTRQPTSSLRRRRKLPTIRIWNR